MRKYLPIGSGLLSTAAILAVVLVIDFVESGVHLQNLRDQVFERLDTTRAKLEEALHPRLNLVRGLAAFVRTREMFSQAEFRVFAEALAQDQPGIRSLQLAPNSVVTYIYPLKGNQAALEHDLMADLARREAVQRAIKGREFILAGPVNLRQGGVAVIGRLPIFVPIPGGGETDADHYWGLAIILIDLEPLLANAGILDQSKGTQYALRGKDGLGADGAVFFGDGAVFDADPVLLDVSLPNGSWQLAAVPKEGWADAWAGQIWLWTGGGAAAVIVGWLIFIVLRRSVQLRENEERFRAVVDHSPGAIVIKDMEGRNLIANKLFCTWYGTTSEKIIGKSIYDFLAKESADRITAQEQVVMETGTVIEEERQVTYPDGVTRSVFTQKFPIFGPDGDCLAVGTVINDITERKRAEEALVQSKQQNEMILEAAGEGIYGLDLQGRATFVNPAAARMIGWELEDFIGRPQHDILHHTKPDGSPYPREECAIYAAFKDGQRHHVTDEVFWRKDGTSFPVEYVSTPIRVEGELVGAVVVFTDITERKRVEEEIRDLAKFPEQNPDPVLRFAKDGILLYANPASALLMKELKCGIGEPAPEDWRRMFAEVLETNSPKEFEYEYGGLTLSFVINPVPEIGYVNVHGRDITARKGAEKALRDSEARMRDLVEYTSDWVWEMDADLRFSYHSERLLKVTGIRPEELLGKTRRELGHGDTDAEKWRQHLADLEARRPFRDFRYRFVHRDGRTLHFLVNGKPVFDEAGSFQGYRGVESDITAQVNAEEQARSAQERLAIAIDGLSEHFVLFDSEDRIVLTNAAWRELNQKINAMTLPGVHFENCVRAAIEAGLLPEAVGREAEWLRWRMDLHRNPKGPFEVERQDGRWVLINEQRLTDGGTVLILSDITERKLREQEKEALERELQQANRMEAIGQLAGGIAHEINTPVQYIGDNLHFLEEACSDLGTVIKKYQKLARAARDKGVLEDEVREAQSAADEADLDYLLDEFPKATKQSLEGTERVANIVLAMKDFSHRSTKEKVAADINQAIKNTVTVSRNEWKHVADVDLDLDAALAPVMCLAGEINQVFLNLITNAAHAIAAKGGEGKGRITVSTRKDGDWVEIRVVDIGAGIPEEVRDKIFNPFFTTKEVGKGTGQGLAICRDIVVSKHGGKIFFETEMGKGTTFVVRLPLDGNEIASEAA